MASSLSNFVDNVTKRIHKIICKDCHCFLEYESFKCNLMKYKCLSCNKDYSNKLDEKLKKRLKWTYKFSDNDINKCIFLLRKVHYFSEYMDEWENFAETKLPENFIAA